MPITARLDADVVDFFRTGEGWQTRLNAFLAAHVKRASKRKPAKSGVRWPDYGAVILIALASKSSSNVIVVRIESSKSRAWINSTN